MARKSKRPLLPNRDEYVGFGLIINRWAGFESLVEDVIAALLRIDSFNGRLFTSGMGYLAKRDLLRTMTEQQSKLKVPRGSDFYADLDKILVEAEPLLTVRNWVGHSIWIPGTRPDAIKPILFRARGKLKIAGHDPKERDFVSEELIEIGLAINELGLRLKQLAIRHRLLTARTAAQKRDHATVLALQFQTPPTLQSNRADPPRRGKPKSRPRSRRA
jgi:hypothetical protein